MSNATVVFDPYAAADVHNFVQTIVVNHNVASTGQTEWYPVAFFLKDEKGEVLGGLLGDIWAAWLHVRTLAVAMPVRGHGFGRELMKRAESYAVERGCTDAFLDTFSFRQDHFTRNSGTEYLGRLKIIPPDTSTISWRRNWKLANDERSNRLRTTRVNSDQMPD
jgi:GNAT superfamily N-acetyltransferase